MFWCLDLEFRNLACLKQQALTQWTLESLLSLLCEVSHWESRVPQLSSDLAFLANWLGSAQVGTTACHTF